MRKMNLMLLAIPLLTIQLAMAPRAHALGGIDSGGLDSKDTNYSSSWFAQPEKQVAYCLQVSENFPVAKTELQALVKKSMDRWFDFLSMDTLASPITKNYSMKDACENTDLRFLFGIDSDEVKKIKERYDSPLAFAHRGQATEDYSWSTDSIIWVSDDIFQKTLKNNSADASSLILEITLSHELGHLLGFKHIPGTIMDDSEILETVLQKPELSTLQKLNRLERTRLLPVGKTIEKTMAGQMTFEGPLSSAGPQGNDLHNVLSKIEQRSNFKYLTGKSTEDAVSASINLQPLQFKGTITIHEPNTGDLVFELDEVSWLECDSEHGLMLIIPSDKSQEANVTGSSCRLNARMKRSDGKVFPIEIIFNKTAPVKIYLEDENRHKITIFEAVL